MRNYWVQLVICLLVSSGIWLLHNLSQSFVSVVSVPVVARTSLPARAELSATDATITAQVRASGYKHLRLAGKKRRPVRIDFDPADFEHLRADLYAIPTARLYKYSTALFGEAATVESFISTDPQFLFNEVTHKKVPVQRVQNLSFEPQYMATREMSVSPDSVYVYGEPSRLEYIDRILTRPIELRDISASVHGTVRLDAPVGVRLSDNEVVYSLDVVRYVEMRRQVKIQTRNVPSHMSLSVLPSNAEVVLHCVFPMASDPFDKMEFYVDYGDFRESISGRCVAKCSGVPSGVIDWTIEPEVFDCIITSGEW